MSTDDRGEPTGPPCGHCGTPFAPGHVTCARCGQARFLGGAVDGAAPSLPTASPSPAVATADAAEGAATVVPAPEPGAGPTDEADHFDLGDPFRDVVRRRPRGPAQRSRTALMIGGLIGLILVVLVAAAARWALVQHGGGVGS